jgi:hypothetical protein
MLVSFRFTKLFKMVGTSLIDLILLLRPDDRSLEGKYVVSPTFDLAIVSYLQFLENT